MHSLKAIGQEFEGDFVIPLTADQHHLVAPLCRCIQIGNVNGDDVQGSSLLLPEFGLQLFDLVEDLDEPPAEIGQLIFDPGWNFRVTDFFEDAEPNELDQGFILQPPPDAPT